MTRRADRRALERAAARRRHPTACWVPDVDRMRRKLAAGAVTPEAYPTTDEPA